MLSHKQLVTVCLLSSFLTFSLFTTSYAAQSSPQQYVVTRVASDDTLNIRAGAGISQEVIATMPFNGRNIQALGETRQVGKTVWVKISWQGQQGWVSKHYLQEVVSDEPSTPTQPVTVTQEPTTPVVQQNEQVVQETAKPKLLKAVDRTEPVAEVTTTVVESDQENHNDAEIDEIQKDIALNSVASTEEDIDTNVEHVDSSDTQLTATDEEDAGNWILQCGDKKPYWKVQLHPDSLAVFRDKYEVSLPITVKKQHKNQWNTALKTVVKGQKGKNNLEMTIKYAYSKRCYDTLSSLVVPYKVTTVFNGETLTGCCHAVQLLEDEVVANDQRISKAP